jgi:hypothetical protein
MSERIAFVVVLVLAVIFGLLILMNAVSGGVEPLEQFPVPGPTAVPNGGP